MVSTQIAINAVNRAEAMRKTRENGLFRSAASKIHTEKSTYLRWKWGNRYSAGTIRNAGNVMRLKMPTTSMKPSMEEARMPELFCILC